MWLVIKPHHVRLTLYGQNKRQDYARIRGPLDPFVEVFNLNP